MCPWKPGIFFYVVVCAFTCNNWNAYVVELLLFAECWPIVSVFCCCCCFVSGVVSLLPTASFHRRWQHLLRLNYIRATETETVADTNRCGEKSACCNLVYILTRKWTDPAAKMTAINYNPTNNNNNGPSYFNIGHLMCGCSVLVVMYTWMCHNGRMMRVKRNQTSSQMNLLLRILCSHETMSSSEQGVQINRYILNIQSAGLNVLYAQV